jgi:hypothetical protein
MTNGSMPSARAVDDYLGEAQVRVLSPVALDLSQHAFDPCWVSRLIPSHRAPLSGQS